MHQLITAAAVVALSGCATTQEIQLDTEHNALRCLGYCDLRISNQTSIARNQLKTTGDDNE